MDRLLVTPHGSNDLILSAVSRGEVVNSDEWIHSKETGLYQDLNGMWTYNLVLVIGRDGVSTCPGWGSGHPSACAG